MPTITTEHGITLKYQEIGDKSAPAIVMIMGLGAQMTVWPDALFYGLAESGFRVIRFDNRDVGQSTHLDQFGSPSLLKAWLSKRLPIKANIPYKLEDMAQDVLALMKALAIKKAHLIGASMGGMIGQIIAAKHKKKVLSLTSIMSTTRPPGLSRENLTLVLRLAKRPKHVNRHAAIDYNVKLNRLIGSPLYPIDDNTLFKQAKKHVERGYNPAGVNRQLVAITASGCRQRMLKKIKAPTLVIHGANDPVIPIAGGIETANSIKKAKLKVVEGMGHDFPPMLMKKMTKWIRKHVNKAENKRQQERATSAELLTQLNE